MRLASTFRSASNGFNEAKWMYIGGTDIIRRWAPLECKEESQKILVVDNGVCKIIKVAGQALLAVMEQFGEEIPGRASADHCHPTYSNRHIPDSANSAYDTLNVKDIRLSSLPVSCNVSRGPEQVICSPLHLQNVVRLVDWRVVRYETWCTLSTTRMYWCQMTIPVKWAQCSR